MNESRSTEQTLTLVAVEAASQPITPQPHLSVIIPVYNEAAVIEPLLRDLHHHLARLLPQNFEVLVIDDGSTDQTATHVTDTIKQLASTEIRLLQRPYNTGNGAAIKTGIRHATGEFLVMMDGDGQHQPADIARLLAEADRFDMVVGARTRQSETALHRDIANWIYNLFAGYICDFPIRDLTSGFRLIRGDMAKRFAYLLPNTFSYPTTLTLAVIRAGHTLTYVPIVAAPRVGHSKIKLLQDGARFFTILFRIAVFFAPLKVFIPISLTFFGTGFLWYLYRVFLEGRGFPPISSLFMTTAVIIFLIGLVSEQITYLRYRDA